MVKKFLQDYFSYQVSHLIGGKKYTDWAAKNLLLLENTPIKNKKLAKELEDACLEKGFLTYSEFLTIDQFGTHGYHNTHKSHGMTDTKFRWPEALAALCKEKGIHHIVEFGPGDGIVGVQALLRAKKLHHELFWSGVEIGKDLQEKARKLFHKKKLDKYLLQLVSTLEELEVKEKCLFVFSYSLDNLIPEVFINTLETKGPPNAMLGVQVKDGLLSEILLSSKVGPSVKVRPLHNGVYQDYFGFSWDLSNWQLNFMQRVYMPLDICRMLYQTANMLPVGSQILIIDEFRLPDTHQQLPYHLGLPRDLQTFSRDFLNFKKFYQTAGSNLLYFPPFLETITSFLSQLGFSFEYNGGEHKFAYKLSGRNTPYPKHPRTLALLTSPKKLGIKKTKFVLSAPE